MKIIEQKVAFGVCAVFGCCF